VAHVKLEGHESATGCDFLLAGVALESLARLLRQDGRRYDEEVVVGPGIETAAHIATLRLVLKREVFPEPMARLVYVLFDEAAPPFEANLAVLERGAGPSEGTEELWVSFLVDHRKAMENPAYVDDVTSEVRRRLGGVVPFMDEFVAEERGPLDGIGSGHGDEEPREALAGSLAPVYSTAAPGPWGACGLGYSTRVRNLVVCSDQVLPGLGTEGLWLAAWGAAGLVSSRDPSKARWKSRMQRL
jgi:hypothetical protein